MHHIIRAQQFDRDFLESFFHRVDLMKRAVESSGGVNSLSNFVVATLFYEPSTRTRLSFEAAAVRTGAQYISTENAKEFSSATKGESLEDTIRTVACYADAIVLRHFEIGAAQKASEVSPVPIINAGDGAGQHPTQALLDLYTIYNELGRIDGLHVGLSGDLANGRTARSLCYLLSKFKDIKLTFIAPSVVQMRDDIKKHLENVGVEFFEIEDLQEVASEVDVLYQTRIQKERFGDRLDKYEQACARQSVDVSILNRMKSHSIVLHPLPRNNEIAPEVDQDPRAAYFRQVKNGLFVRMALLEYVLT